MQISNRAVGKMASHSRLHIIATGSVANHAAGLSYIIIIIIPPVVPATTGPHTWHAQRTQHTCHWVPRRCARITGITELYLCAQVTSAPVSVPASTFVMTCHRASCRRPLGQTGGG